MYEEKLYWFDKEHGFLGFRLTAHSGSNYAQDVPSGDPEILYLYESGEMENRVIEFNPSVFDFDANKDVSVQYFCRFVDRLATMTHNIAYNTWANTSPSVHARYCNKLATRACKVMQDVLSMTFVPHVAKICDYPVKNSDESNGYLRGWKWLLVTAQLRGVTLTFHIDPLADLRQKYSEPDINPNVRGLTTMFVSYGTDAKNNVLLTSRLDEIIWDLDGEGNTVIKPRVNGKKEAEIKFQRSFRSGGELLSASWMEHVWTPISPERAKEIAPHMYERILQKDPEILTLEGDKCAVSTANVKMMKLSD